MPYTPQTWIDGPAGLTPLSAARLAVIEAGLANAEVALRATPIKTSAYTAAAGDLIPVDTTAGAVTITAPPAPTDTTQFAVKLIASTTPANAVTIAAAGVQHFNTATGSTALTLSTLRQLIVVQWSSSAGVWYVIDDSLDLNQLDLRYATSAALAAQNATFVKPSQVVSTVYGDGVTDATAYIQGRINATPVGGTLYIPRGIYKLSSALVIAQSINIVGEGIAEIWQSIGVSGGASINIPPTTPYITGTVLLQSAAATDGITISGTAVCANLSHFGIRFDSSILGLNTGHGVNATPTATYSSGHDTGAQGCKWEDLIVYGHDGNHYAFNRLNSIYTTDLHLRSYGGGGSRMYCDSYFGNYGNHLSMHTHFEVFFGGTAHGILLDSRGYATPGLLNLITMLKPQVVVSTNGSALFAGRTNATSTQRTFNGLTVQWISLVGQDFESTAGSTAIFPNNQQFIEPGGLVDGGVSATPVWQAARSTNSSKVLFSDLSLSPDYSGLPSVVTVVPMLTSSIATIGSWTRASNSGQVLGGVYYNTSSSLNDEVNWDVNLAPGTWSLELQGSTSTGYGTATVSLDDGHGNFTSLGTWDQYTASTANNASIIFPGRVVPYLGGGSTKFRVKVKVTSKNASSTNYTCSLSSLVFTKTA